MRNLFATLPRTHLAICLLCLLPLAGGLLNTSIFGPLSLTAYFGFALPAWCCLLILLVKMPVFGPLPLFVQVFLGLSACIYLHGLITHTTNLTHDYWVVLGCWLLVCSQLKNGQGAWVVAAFLLPAGITILACLESLWVVLQLLGWVATMNPLFPCTGSWANPNVTAVFLAMSLFYILSGVRRKPKHIAAYLPLVLVLIAIGLLRCRSAYLVSALFLGGYGWEEWWCAGRPARWGKRLVAWGAVSVLFLLFLGWLTYHEKQVSTTSRVRIWKHSLQLIRQRPVSGYGFGLFEREYNLSAAKEQLPGTEPVSMPYNDFVQLGVEGGLPAVAAWALCIGLLVYDQLKGKGPVLPVAAWLLIQLTNFGFQNIPAFALFLLYAGIEHCTEARPPVRMPWRKIISIGLSVFAACLLVAQWRLAQAFYQVQEQAEEMDPAWVPAAYEALYARLYNAPYYLERVGDTRMAMQQYTEARRYYLQAMYYSSHESLLGKTGYCYQQEKRYDSSEYYFTLLQNMAPARFSPRMALLNMYRQKGDTVSMIAKATEIIHLPVKVPGAEVERIKTYAHTLLNELRK